MLVMDNSSFSEVNKYIESFLNRSKQYEILFNTESNMINALFGQNTSNNHKLNHISNDNKLRSSSQNILNNSIDDNKSQINTANVIDHNNLNKDFFVTEDAKLNDKLILPPSCFPEGCVCGHFHEFRGIDFACNNIRKPIINTKLNVNPVKIKLRSQK